MVPIIEDSDFGGLPPSIPNEESVIEVLRALRRESKQWRIEQATRQEKLEQEVRTLRLEIQQNTEMTAVVRDVVTTTRVATKVIKWIGAIALAIGSTWWAWKEIAGRAAHNITPGP